MPALQKKHKKSSVHNIKSVMNTRYVLCGQKRCMRQSLAAQRFSDFFKTKRKGRAWYGTTPSPCVQSIISAE